jgi:hypothetical protein
MIANSRFHYRLGWCGLRRPFFIAAFFRGENEKAEEIDAICSDLGQCSRDPKSGPPQYGVFAFPSDLVATLYPSCRVRKDA